MKKSIKNSEDNMKVFILCLVAIVAIVSIITISFQKNNKTVSRICESKNNLGGLSFLNKEIKTDETISYSEIQNKKNSVKTVSVLVEGLDTGSITCIGECGQNCGGISGCSPTVGSAGPACSSCSCSTISDCCGCRMSITGDITPLIPYLPQYN